MKVILKRTLSFIIIGLMFALMFLPKVNTKASSIIEAKDYKNIIINPDTLDTHYNIKDMLGVDTDRSSGDIYYYSDTHTLKISSVKLYQIEDPLEFDSEGNNLPLIEINIDSKYKKLFIEIDGESEILNYGSFIEINGTVSLSNPVDVEVYGCMLNASNILKINNRRCYNGEELPSILLNVPSNLKFADSGLDFTMILSGVGGIEARNSDNSKLDFEAGSLFINVNSESVDYFIDNEEPLENQLNFDYEEPTYNYALSGFSEVNISKELPKDIRYDFDSKCSCFYKDGAKTKSNEFYYGDFIYIKNLSDLMYYLQLSKEHQGNGYLNLVLMEDIEIKFDEDYVDLMGKNNFLAFLNVHGYKRLFLNNHEIRGLYDEDGDTISHPLMRLWNYSRLDIFGSHFEYPNGHGNRIVYAYSNDDSGRSCSMISCNAAQLNLYGGVQLISIEDGDEDFLKTGDISDYSINGNVITTISDGVLNIYDADIWGGGGYSASTSQGTSVFAGVVCAHFNIRTSLNMYGGAIHSGDNNHSNGYLVYLYGGTADENAIGFKYYGGLLQAHGFTQKRLIFTGKHNKTFVANPNWVIRYENEIDSLLNYDHSFVNEKPVLIESGYYQAGTFNSFFDSEDMNSKIWGNYIRYADPYYAPYIKEDLPDNIYVNGESKIQEFKITLHNPDNLYDNTDDYTWTKHYSAQLYIKNGDDVILYNEALGNPYIGMEPYKSLGLIYKDKIYTEYGVDYTWTDHNEPILVVKPTFPKEYDGLKVQIVIRNEYTGAVAYSNVATIHVTQEIVEPVITLTGPKEAFTSDGYYLELGKSDPESKIKARITNEYSNTIFVEWYDIGINGNDVTPITGRLEYKMTHLDSNGMYYQDIEFTPPTGSTALGLHGYKLYVWTYSKYGDNSFKITYSRTVKFNVGSGTPNITSNLPNQLNLEENDYIDLGVTVDDAIPNVGYEWYYYPDYDYYTGIDQANSKVTLGTLKPILSSDKALLQSNGNKNVLTYDLFDKLELGKKYRVIFKESSDTLDGLVNVTLEYGDGNHYVTPITEEYYEINGNYEFNKEFSYLIVDRADMYLNPNYCKLVIEFKDKVTSKAMHVFTDFYLEEYDEENDSWIKVSNLNPYHYGLNYEGVYQLKQNNEQIKTSSISNLQAQLSMDGYYVYCKVYNKLDPTKYVYSHATKLNIGLTSYQPEFSEPDYIIDHIGFGDTNELNIGVNEPIINGNWVVDYSCQAIIETLEKDINNKPYIKQEYVSLSDMSDYGFTISFTKIANEVNAGKAHFSITLRNDALNSANSLYNHHFVIELTAFSPTDSNLTDTKLIDVMFDYPDEGVEISSITFRGVNGVNYEYDMTSNSESKFYSNDGTYQIHDVLYLTSQTIVTLTCHRINHYSNFDLDNDQKAFYVWKVKWLEQITEDEYIPVDMDLEDLYNSALKDYAYIEFDNNRLIFRFLNSKDSLDSLEQLKYRNLVVYCEVYNYENGYEMYTEYYQLSYIDFSLMDRPKVTLTDPVLDPATGKVKFNATVNTGIYNNVFYVDYDLNYKRLLAKDNDKYEVKAQSSASGLIEIYGPGYQRNNFKNYGDGTYACDWEEDIEYLIRFNKDDSPYAFTYEISISTDALIEIIQKGDNAYTDPELIDFIDYFSPNYRIDEYDLAYEFGENFEELFDRLWYHSLSIYGALVVSLNGDIPLYYYELDPAFYSNDELLNIIYPCDYYSSFKDYEYVQAKLNDVKVIGEYSPLMQFYTRYSWSVYNTHTGEVEILVANSDDCYLEIDTSKYFVDRIFTLETTISSTEGFYEGTYYSYYTDYYVEMIPNVIAPTITGLSDKEFQLRDPNARIEAVVTNNDPDNALLSYEFSTDMYYDWPNTSEIAIYVRATSLGEYKYKFICHVTYNYLDEYGNERSYTTEFTSSEYKITVTERIVSSVDIIGIESPVALEHPTVEGIERGEVLPGDEFFGYRIIAKYYSINNEDYFEYDKNYTLTVIIEAIDGAEFTDSITAKFNSLYNANVNKLSDTQFQLTYDFLSTESVAIDKIELTLPDYEVGGVIRPLDIIETDYCALHDFSFNTNDTNFEYGKVYTLNTLFRVYSQYHLSDDAKVYINGVEHDYTYQNGMIEINYEYYFPYTVKVIIGEKEELFETAKDNYIALIVLDSDIPSGYVFTGWFIGENLISNKTSANYKVSENGLVIVAKLISVTLINEVNIGENSYKAGDFVPLLPQLVYDGYTIDYEFNTEDSKFAFLKSYILKVIITPKYGYGFSENTKVYRGTSEVEYTISDGAITINIEYFFLYSAKYDLGDNNIQTIYSDEAGKIELTASESIGIRPFVGWYQVLDTEEVLVSSNLKLEVTLNSDGNYYKAIYKDILVIDSIDLPSLPNLVAGSNAISSDNALTDVSYRIDTYLGNDLVTGKIEYLKEYKLLVTIRANEDCYLDSNATIKVNNQVISATYNSNDNTFSFYSDVIVFFYEANVKILDDTKVVKSDITGTINLELGNVLAGKIFIGWYKGDELISDKENTTYVLNANGVTITARLDDIKNIDSVNVSEYEFEVRSNIPSIDPIETESYRIEFSFATVDYVFSYLKNYTLNITITPKFGYEFSSNVKVYLGNGVVEFSINDGIITLSKDYIFYYYANYAIGDGETKTIYSDKDGKIELTAPDAYNNRPFIGWYIVTDAPMLVTNSLTLTETLTSDGTLYKALYKEYTYLEKVELSDISELSTGNQAINTSYDKDGANITISTLYNNEVVTSDIEFLKEYKLVVTITALEDYYLDNLTSLYVNGTKVNASFNNETKELTYTVGTYLFLYEVTINILGISNKIKSNINGEVNLGMESIPSDKEFVGWFIGEELISSELHYVYKVNSNDLVIVAKFRDTASYEEKDGNYVISGDNDDIKDAIDKASDDNKGLEVEGTDLTVIFDSETVKELANNDVVTLLILTGEEYATGDIKKANLSNVKLVLEISLDNIPNNLNAEIKVPINFEVKEGEVVKVFYVSPDGIIENMDAKYENGIVSFKTHHFSTYVVTLDTENSDNPGEENKKNNSWIIILIIVLIVLIGGGLLLFFLLKKKKDNNEPDKNEEASGSAAQDEAKEEEKGVIFKDKKSLNEEYAELSKADRKLYDTLKAKALGLKDVRTSEAIDSYTVYSGKDKLLRLKIKSGKIIAEFFANDSGLKEIVGSGSKDAATTIKVTNEEDLQKAIDALNYKYESLNKKE